MCLLGQGNSTSGPLGQLRTAKTVQIVLEESCGKVKNIRLPVKKTVQQLLLTAGLKIVESAADIGLKMEIKGRAISRFYSRSGSRTGDQTG